MIRLLDLPGAQALEDFALLHGGPDTYKFDEQLEAFCQAQFKTNSVSVASFTPPDSEEWFGEDDGYSDEEEEVQEDDEDEELDDEIPTICVPTLVMDDDIVAYLFTLGWDLRNQMGQPLSITKRIALTVECVAKGIVGSLPDTEKVEAERFARGLEEQARLWKTSRRA